MNFEAGIRFIIFLALFGVTNYLMMLTRYEKDLKNMEFLQKQKISKLYPKGSHIF